MKSINDATPEDWDKLSKHISRYSTPNDVGGWPLMEELDDEPNDHPVYGEPAEKRMAESYDADYTLNVPPPVGTPASQLKKAKEWWTGGDNVHKPEHYNSGSIECIDAIQGMLTHDEYIGYLRGNALKYQWRFRYKGKPVEDLRKARWYEERLINYMLEHPSDK